MEPCRVAASTLRDPAEVAKFHLDECPRSLGIAGFDLDPEYLYQLVTGTSILLPREESQG